MVKFALFTFRSVRVSVFQRVQSVFRERERGVLLWSESSYDASLRMKKRENEELCCENERNVPHLLQVNNIFVARRLELIGIPPTFSSPTLFSSVVLVEDDDAAAAGAGAVEQQRDDFDDDEKKKKKKKKSLSIFFFGGGGGRGGARKRESSGTNGTSCLILSLFRRRKVRETKRREDAIS